MNVIPFSLYTSGPRARSPVAVDLNPIPWVEPVPVPEVIDPQTQEEEDTAWGEWDSEWSKLHDRRS